jgi:hypothetical protein
VGVNERWHRCQNGQVQTVKSRHPVRKIQRRQSRALCSSKRYPVCQLIESSRQLLAVPQLHPPCNICGSLLACVPRAAPTNNSTERCCSDQGAYNTCCSCCCSSSRPHDPNHRRLLQQQLSNQLTHTQQQLRSTAAMQNTKGAHASARTAAAAAATHTASAVNTSVPCCCGCNCSALKQDLFLTAAAVVAPASSCGPSQKCRS